MKRALCSVAVFVLGLAWSGASWAGARLVITVTDPCVVVLDGTQRHDAQAGQRVAMSHVPAGVHRIEFRSLDGGFLYETLVDLPDATEVAVRYGIQEGAVVTSPMGVIGPDVQAGSATPAAAADPSAGPERAAADDPVESSFDTNEGKHNPQRVYEQGTDARANYRGFQQAAGTTARVVGTTVAPGGAGVVATGGSYLVRGTTNALRTAEAGGLDALRGGRSGSSFKQGRPIPPQAETGSVTLISTAGEPYLVFLEGFTVATFNPGTTKQKVKLEVGRHLLELWDTDAASVRWKGVVQIDKDQNVTVEFSDAQAPAGTERGWAWSAR